MSGYHAGELSAQRKAGLSSQGQSAGRMIRSEFPLVAQEFLAAQPMLVLAGADASGRMWTSLLTGPPGFLRVVGPETLQVDAAPVAGDPLAEPLRTRTQVGLIAIEPATRRRMRINGWAHPHGNGLEIQADQVFANCPKYISGREPHVVDSPTLAHTSEGTSLSQDQQRRLRAADAFFLGTRSAAGDVDASHRGGNPGVITVHDATHLSFPDYVGNAMMLTLGNLEQDPAVGVLVPDWTTGDVLMLSGSARVEWEPGADAPPGAQRVVHVSVEQVRDLAGHNGLRWDGPELSRFNPA